MIIYLKHNEIDKQKWDESILRSANGTVCALSWWLDFVSPNWEALVKGDYKIVMPLTCRKKYLINYLFHPYFTKPFGVFSNHKLTEYSLELFMEQIPSKFRSKHIVFNSQNIVPTDNFEVKINNSYTINLNKTYLSIFGHYSLNQKRNIKKAVNLQLQINRKTNPDEIIKLFRENKGKKVKNLGNKEYKMLLGLLGLIEKHCKI